jgi:alkylation response protein AidB-like acyl-CoA dehydrogenase
VHLGRVVLEGVLEGTATHIFAIVPTAQEGIVFADDWDNLGQRLTESGSVEIRDVRVPSESDMAMRRVANASVTSVDAPAEQAAGAAVTNAV